MLLVTLNTPYLPRKEAKHGQGGLTYSEENGVFGEQIAPQSAPDPVRYGDTPARPSRRTFALMSQNLSLWGNGIASDFLTGGPRPLVKRLQPAGRQLNIRSQNRVAIRPNIYRPSAAAYGSLFQMGSQSYDLVGA